MGHAVATSSPPDREVGGSVQYSIRDLMLASAVIAWILGAYTSIGIFAASASALVIGVVVFRRARRTKRGNVALLGVLLAIPAFLVTGLLLLVWWTVGVGPVFFRSSWPDELERMVAACDLDVAGAKVFCNGDFMGKTYVWRLTVPADKLARIERKLGLTPLPPEAVPADFSARFPKWWRPNATATYRFLATPNFPSYNEDYLVAYDAKGQWLYVWFNWEF